MLEYAITSTWRTLIKSDRSSWSKCSSSIWDYSVGLPLYSKVELQLHYIALIVPEVPWLAADTCPIGCLTHRDPASSWRGTESWDLHMWRFSVYRRTHLHCLSFSVRPLDWSELAHLCSPGLDLLRCCKPGSSCNGRTVFCLTVHTNHPTVHPTFFLTRRKHSHVLKLKHTFFLMWFVGISQYIGLYFINFICILFVRNKDVLKLKHKFFLMCFVGISQYICVHFIYFICTLFVRNKGKVYETNSYTLEKLRNYTLCEISTISGG